MTSFIKALKRDAHKYSHGRVAVVAGSKAFSGAAVLAVGGARRGGSGYINYLVLDRLPSLLVLRDYPDVVLHKRVENIDANAWVIGPGSPKLRNNFQTPRSSFAVLDADAMDLAQKINAEHVVITPHLGEARKLGFEIGATLDSRSAAALEMAKKYNAYVLLKGEETVIASPSGLIRVESEAGPELATAGTGDILAGLLGSMLASWNPKTDSEIVEVISKAVQMHALAGKRAAKKFNPVVATDVLAALGRI